MSKKASETLRYPTDKEHLQAIQEIYEMLTTIWERLNLAEQVMEEANSLLIYKYLILKELLQGKKDLNMSPKELHTWDVFQKYLVFGELPFVGWLNLVIDDLTNLLDKDKWKEYMRGGKELITG